MTFSFLILIIIIISIRFIIPLTLIMFGIYKVKKKDKKGKTFIIIGIVYFISSMIYFIYHV